MTTISKKERKSEYIRQHSDATHQGSPKKKKRHQRAHAQFLAAVFSMEVVHRVHSCQRAAHTASVQTDAELSLRILHRSLLFIGRTVTLCQHPEKPEPCAEAASQKLLSSPLFSFLLPHLRSVLTQYREHIPPSQGHHNEGGMEVGGVRGGGGDTWRTEHGCPHSSLPITHFPPPLIPSFPPFLPRFPSFLRLLFCLLFPLSLPFLTSSSSRPPC